MRFHVGLLRPLRSLQLQAESRVGSSRRSLAALATMATADSDEVLASEARGIRIATLNRPRALNALNAPMVNRLRELYTEWEADPRVHVILIKGSGRAFCAGGDVRSVYSLGSGGQVEACRAFFESEYKMNYQVATLRKPQVAVLNGTVMGGGNGVAMHGTFRVATENSVAQLFAMPETAIALHPDVGASFFLPRLPGSLGEFLGLTGTRLDGADMLHTGLATHFVPSDRLDMMEERLSALGSGEVASLEGALREHGETPAVADGSPLMRRHLIDQCFSLESVEDIVAALRQKVEEGEEWCRHPLAALAKSSPTSLKVTLRSIREGRRERLWECLAREFRLTTRCLEATVTHDFYEWQPATLEEVTQEMVEAFYAPLPANAELDLAVEEREPQARL